MTHFDDMILSASDHMLARMILKHRGGFDCPPDLTIAPDGSPYLYRWHLIPRNDWANVYFHIQVASDPERPLHDHPWNNTSVILSGGYDEILNSMPWNIGEDFAYKRELRQGRVVHRKATEAHRLILPPQFKYAMTIFSTGPKVREWGFWFKDGWRSADEVTAMENGQSVMTEEARAQAR